MTPLKTIPTKKRGFFMPRKKRIVIPNLAHHVTQRGNYRQNIFHRDRDFRNYLYWMQNYALKYKVSIIAYCLMNNHVHFIVVPNNEQGLARLFNSVHMRYCQYKNKENNRKGHLWQGRFFSCILSAGHLYRAVRYVEQNPVRAKMVEKAWHYIWSSARQHVGLEESPIIKTDDPRKILKILNYVSNWKSYLEKRDDEIRKEIINKTQKGLVVGSKEFILKLEQRVGVVLRELKRGRPRRAQK